MESKKLPLQKTAVPKPPTRPEPKASKVPKRKKQGPRSAIIPSNQGE